jgi:hypothetical protein
VNDEGEPHASYPASGAPGRADESQRRGQRLIGRMVMGSGLGQIYSDEIAGKWVRIQPTLTSWYLARASVYRTE